MCVIKEEDLDVLIERPNFTRSPRVPSRVVMNNKTITVFVAPSYDSVYVSYDLKNMNVRPSREDPDGCFTL
jgi:hypothetical protein